MEVVRITFEGRCSYNSPRYTRNYHALLPSETFSRFHQQVVSITLRDFSLKSDAKIRKRIGMAKKLFNRFARGRSLVGLFRWGRGLLLRLPRGGLERGSVGQASPLPTPHGVRAAAHRERRA